MTDPTAFPRCSHLKHAARGQSIQNDCLSSHIVVGRTEVNSKRIGDIWPSQGTCGSFLFDSLLEGKRDGSGFTDSVNTKGKRWKDILEEAR